MVYIKIYIYNINYEIFFFNICINYLIFFCFNIIIFKLNNSFLLNYIYFFNVYFYVFNYLFLNFFYFSFF